MKHAVKKTLNNFTGKFGLEIRSVRKPDDTPLYRKLFGHESVENMRFYNVCAGGHMRYGGGFSHPLWRNLDILRPDVKGWDVSFNPQKDILHDMLQKNNLPVEDGTAEIIQSQYSIEHVHDEAASHFFKEAHRALKPGGFLKIVTPNIDLDYHAYINGDKSYFAIESLSRKEVYEKSRFHAPFNKISFEQVFLSRFASNATIMHSGNNPNKIADEEFLRVFNEMDIEDAFTYCSSKCSVELQKEIRYNHINWWNHAKVIRFLNEAGFNNCRILAPGQSATPVLRNRNYFDNLWNYVALFVEARKDK